MNSWQLSTEHPGYRFKTITCGNCTVTVLRPELDPTTRTKVENHVKAVAEHTLKNYIKRR